MATIYGPDVDVAMTIVEWPEWGEWDAFYLFGRVVVSNGPYYPNDQSNPNLFNGYSLLLLDWSPVTSNHTVRAQIYKHTNSAIVGGHTALGSNFDQLVADGDAFGLRIVGTTITAHYRSGGVWTQILSVTDSTHADEGYAGFYMPGCINPGTFSHPGYYDDFRVGTLAPSPGAFPVAPVVDAFTRADAATLGTHWEGFIQVGDALGGMSAGISTNRAYNTDFTYAGDHFWSYLYEAGSKRNLLTGLGHTVTGTDNLLAGQSNTVQGATSQALGTLTTVIANRSIGIGLDDAPHTLSDDNTLEVWADTIRLNGLEIDPSGGIGQSLDDLTDVTITSPASGQVPVYNGSAWVNRALSFTQFWPAAVNDQGGVYAPLWNSNGDATAPAYTAEAGSNLTAGSLEFVDSGTNQLFQTFCLPDDWTGALDLKIFWKCAPTSGNVVWQVQTAAITIGGSFDPTWNTAQTVTDAAQGTTQLVNVASISTLTTTGLVAGGWLAFRIIRDPSHASDTLGASAFFLGAELKYRRTLA